MTKEDNGGRIRLALEGRLARIELNRPPLNVLDIPAIQELRGALDRCLGDRAVDVIVLSGAGKAFSAGVDVKDHTPDRVGEMLGGFHGIFRALASGDRITIAAVHGACLGGGLELAAACDFFVCEETARLAVPEIEVGCFPPVAAACWPSSVGPRRSADWILTGRSILVDEAHKAGLVSRVVAAGKLAEAVDELVGSLLAKSSPVLRIALRALRAGRPGAFPAALDRVESLYHDDLLKTDDVWEGVEAFTDKRRPVWRHR